jgi:hypothetical protein
VLNIIVLTDCNVHLEAFCRLSLSPTNVKHIYVNNILYIASTPKGKGKGKAVPLQAWSGPEGSRKLRFPDYMTTAQDDGRVVSLTHWPPLPPGNTPGTHFC